MLVDLDVTLARRMEAMFHFLDEGGWDFFHTHIMGSDRINHFLWEKMEAGDAEFAPGFFRYYRKIDEYIGKLLARLDDDTALLIFSDHGFCSIKEEVQLSRYLVEMGWTRPAAKIEHPLSINPADSRGYCLIPGRIFVNLRGREPEGIVPLEEYGQVREAMAADLLKLVNPKTNEPVIKKVLRREEVYWPSGSSGCCAMSAEEVARAGGTFGDAADLIAVPYDGYDLKLGLGGDKIFQRTQLEGMHTYDDAFMVARGIDMPDNLEIMMVAGPILDKLGVARPKDMDCS
jgi:predicted AlkP superfamily phosphohydrolase/phosphomutase